MNYSLHYKIKGSGPITLILLHGVGWHSDVWEEWTNLLQQQYQIILIDLPGHGESKSFPSDIEYSLQNIVIQILCITPSLLPAIWIGWSFGGLIATWAAIHYPERVMKLVLIAFSPKFLQDEQHGNWPGIQFSQFKSLSLAIEQDIASGLNRFLILQCLHDSYFKNCLHSCKKWKNLKTIFRSKPAPSLLTLKKYLDILLKTDLREDVIKIQCRTLMIHGDKDQIIPIEIFDRIKIPIYNIKIITGTGHIPFITQAIQSLNILMDFINYNE